MSALLRLVRRIRRRAWQGLVLLVAALVLSSCGWRGISQRGDSGRSGQRVGVLHRLRADAGHAGDQRQQQGDGRRRLVGSIKAINLKNWVATLTLGMDKNVKLPKNATAKIGQTSLLGSQHVELARAAKPVAGAAQGRRHHSAEELVGLSHDRADAGQPLPDLARRRHPEPGSAAERGLQHLQRAGRPDPVPSSASWTPSPAS